MESRDPESDQPWTEEATRGEPSPKRRRLTSDSLTRRKRNATACRFCRVRKAKRDNTRPVCGYCSYHKARCIYDDGNEEAIQYDGANQTILERLDEIKQLLQQNNNRSDDRSHGAEQAGEVWPQTSSIDSPALDKYPTVGPDDSNDVHLGHSRYPFTATRCESLLKWPIFREVVPEKDLQVESFILDTDDDFSDEQSPQSSSRSTYEAVTTKHLFTHGIQEESFVPLCRKFLAYVHPRNPILEADDLLFYAKSAAENGLQWDAASCLVLLACAMAIYARPWKAPVSSLQNVEADIEISDILLPEEMATAETYYLAAKKRIGLLETSILDIQCLFFASIYEKHAFRPLQAWFYVQQASTRLQTHLMRRKPREQSDSPPRHLEQRVFWSCVKSECELYPEVGLPRSGLEDLTYPNLFPQPPATLSSIPANENPSGDSPDVDGQQAVDEQRSWFFYTVEISMRRTINDTLWILYRKGEQYWMDHIDALLRQYTESEKDISLWYSHLPQSIRFDDSCLPDNELSFYLQGRFMEWREYVMRPILYYVLHNRPGQACEPQVLGLAQQHVDLCARTVLRSVHHHHHGGTWFVARHNFSCAVLILAVVLNPAQVCPPRDWPAVVRLAIKYLGALGTVAPHLARMRDALERLFVEVCQRSGLDR